MTKTLFALSVLLAASSLYAVDGVVLINQATVLAAGGFPYKITQAGSYKLSGNLTVSDPNLDGIDVTANNVTIDLNGFSIVGVVTCTYGPSGWVTSCSPLPPSGFAAYGIRNAVASQGTTVLNGSVRGFTLGLYLNGSNIIKDVHADSNWSTGMSVSGTISNSTATGNGVNGINISGTATGNFAAKNGFAGLSGQGTFSGNTASQNGNSGFSISCPSVIIGNTAFLNRFPSPVSDPTCVTSNNIF